MRLSRWQMAGAVTCLVAGPLGQLVQYLVSPMKEAGSPSVQVAAAVAHPQSMHAALILDVLLLLLLPAVLSAGRVAGAARSRLAAAGTALAFVSMLGAGYLLAQDVVVSAAAAQPDPHAAAALVSAYENNAVVTGITVVYLGGHVIGFILLGIALVRSKAVPTWAGIALCLWPVGEMAGEAAGLTAVAAAGFALLLLAFGACALALVSGQEASAAQLVPSVAEQSVV
jgi:hypothetical protein